MSTNDWPTSYYAPAPSAPQAWPGQYQPQVQYASWQAPPPRRSGWGVGMVVFRIFLVLLLLFGALVAYRAGRNVLRDHIGKTYTLPDRIGSASLMTTPEAQRVAEQMLEPVKNLHRPISGVYAVRGTPAIFLIAGDADDASSRRMMSNAAAEGTADGFTVGAPRAFGDVSCAPLTAPIRGVMCAWAGKTSDGLILHVNAKDLGAVAKEATQARKAVEA